MQNGQSLLSNPTNMQHVSIFQAQMEYHKVINILPDETYNNIHLLSYVASQANNDVLYYHQAMQSKDADSFREAMATEIASFKEENIFEIIPIKNKPADKNLILFI